VDNFNNDNTWNDQAGARDAGWFSTGGAYQFSMTSGLAGNDTPALKIDFNKTAGQEWSYVALGSLNASGNRTDYSGNADLALHVYGNVNLKFKFKDTSNRESGESDITVNSPTQWSNITWNYGSVPTHSCDLTQIAEILIFPQPGTTGSGTFYIDNVEVGPGSQPPVPPTFTPTATVSPTATRTSTVTATRTPPSEIQLIDNFNNDNSWHDQTGSRDCEWFGSGSGIFQFAMMSIANERIERRGEILLSTPAGPLTIIAGKMLPYFLLMIAVCSAIVLITGGSFVVILPLVPVILFFLAAALLIGMTARSFRELSFLSIFFSTVMTSYLFFPSIFANVHVISLISPLTLVVLHFQGTGFTAADYLYATALFWLSTAVVLWLCARNFTEEQLFSQERLTSRLRSFIFAAMARDHPFASLVAVNLLAIPLIFMVQLMYLVLLFNLPLPWSLLALILLAAFTEEVAKSIGILALFRGIPGFFTWRTVLLAAVATGFGFLLGEKLLLFVMMAQVTGSLFGSVLFSGVGLLWMPFLLHTAGALIVGAVLKIGGRRAYLPGLLLATAVHASYNLILIGGAL